MQVLDLRQQSERVGVAMRLILASVALAIVALAQVHQNILKGRVSQKIILECDSCGEQ